MSQSPEPPDPSRRSLLKATLAGVSGLAALSIPLGAGVVTFLAPLRRGSGQSDFIRITNLSALPADGVPRRFVVVAERSNAWQREDAVAVGAVFLRRTGENAVHALNVACPHAGCYVGYSSEKRSFLCPCHDSTFALDGKINDRKSPSPRAMDALEVQIRENGEVWVKFQNFRSGTAARIPA